MSVAVQVKRGRTVGVKTEASARSRQEDRRK